MERDEMEINLKNQEKINFAINKELEDLKI